MTCNGFQSLLDQRRHNVNKLLTHTNLEKWKIDKSFLINLLRLRFLLTRGFKYGLHICRIQLHSGFNSGRLPHFLCYFPRKCIFYQTKSYYNANSQILMPLCVQFSDYSIWWAENWLQEPNRSMQFFESSRFTWVHSTHLFQRLVPHSWRVLFIVSQCSPHWIPRSSIPSQTSYEWPWTLRSHKYHECWHFKQMPKRRMD